MTADSQVFFGYPSRPEASRETLARVVAGLDRVGGLAANSWEDLRVAGRIIIDRILSAIDGCDIAVFDVTSLNENVMFEVGYSIASDSRIWLVRDTSDVAAERRWNEVGILTNVGYQGYENSDDIVGAFLKQRPDLQEDTLFRESIEPKLDPVTDPTLFYAKSPNFTDAEREITRQVQRQRRAGIRCIIADARESSVEPLTWYAYQCYTAAAVLVHFARPGRRGASVHNARCALISGLARGFLRPVLMLAEEGYETPIDYRDLLYVYESARDAKTRTRYWLGRELSDSYAQLEQRAAQAQQRSLSTELAGIRLGEPVAENEADRLSQYFLATASYRDVLALRTRVFVGRKGTGKTANLLQAANELAEDKRNLVTVIRPADYDLEGLLRLLRRYSARDAKGYLVESIWKYLLLSEIALALRDDVADRPAGLSPGTSEWELDAYLRGPGQVLDGDFAVRLEETVDALECGVDDSKISDERTRISEALHSTVLHDLRVVLARALGSRTRVAVLIDNLDQAWETEADLDTLSTLLLGLLTSVDKVSAELSQAGQSEFAVTLGVFIRSDIYYRVMRSAREPDKVPSERLTWKDPELLLRVVEERYAAGRGAIEASTELWDRYFVDQVDGVLLPDYLTSRVLPRPRDILYLCNAAIDAAVRRRHTLVTEEDVREGERTYSRFAFEALGVESSPTMPEAEDVLYGFAGMDEIVGLSQVHEVFKQSGLPSHRHRSALDHLVLMSFLGVEISHNTFEFAEDPREKRRSDALARRYSAGAESEPRYRIHPAFHSYLGIQQTMASRSSSAPLYSPPAGSS